MTVAVLHDTFGFLLLLGALAGVALARVVTWVGGAAWGVVTAVRENRQLRLDLRAAKAAVAVAEGKVELVEADARERALFGLRAAEESRERVKALQGESDTLRRRLAALAVRNTPAVPTPTPAPTIDWGEAEAARLAIERYRLETAKEAEARRAIERYRGVSGGSCDRSFYQVPEALRPPVPPTLPAWVTADVFETTSDDRWNGHLNVQHMAIVWRARASALALAKQGRVSESRDTLTHPAVMASVERLGLSITGLLDSVSVSP